MSHRDALLLELGCEELPARMLDDQSRLLAEGIGKRLEAAGLIASTGAIRCLATPRRLALLIPEVLARQPDRELDRKGPAEQAAFDADGNPTRAAEGFARSVGLAVDELERLETDQGRWLFARISQPGKSLDEIVQDALEATVREMAGARSMRWSDRDDRFLRPVRWLCALHGERVVELEAFGLSAGGHTQGHRIHAPGKHPVASATDYEATLAEAFVLADPDQRQERIRQQVDKLAAEAGLVAGQDGELLSENSGLTEWPVAVLGRFDPAFLEVPEEALVSSMRQHQKCFPLRRAEGGLADQFIAVANIESRDPAAMTAGFERVIHPRLADAAFFWKQDRRTPLADRRERLEEVKFQEKLGSVGAKAQRIEQLAVRLATSLGANGAATARAAALCKCDLVTEMVGEFPELQGIMGRHYALADGEDASVADAIESHYRPRHAGDALPADPAGQALALADRLDTLVGIFAAGKKPKGSKDPFALRRAGLGVVRILEATDCGLTLPELVAAAGESLAGDIEIPGEVIDEVVQFLNERLRSHAQDAALDNTTIQAVTAGKTTSVADFMARARAVQSFAEKPEAESLIAANKRTSNLLKQAEGDTIGSINEQLLSDEAEIELFREIQRAESALAPMLEQGDYQSALTQLSSLRDPVDRFFEAVMVMSDDPAVRTNRLALLSRLRGLIADIADLARLGR